jgi:RNA polymerase sigma-54 factor
MTPQLRQAIKLLQFSNFEVAAFVDGELERNPLLERDERSDAAPESPAPDQRIETIANLDSSDLVRLEKLPDAVEVDHANSYDQGSASDGFSGSIGSGGRDGARDFGDDRGIDELAATPRNLRNHLGEQLRLGLTDPKHRLIGAHLIALIDGAGRVSATDEEIATAMGVEPLMVGQVRQTMMRFDPAGLFAVNLRDCLAAQLADRNRLDPAMEALLDNLELLARRDHRALMAVCEVDGEDLTQMISEIRALDPKPGAGWDDGPLQQVIPDVLMRALPDGEWFIELNPETMPRVLVNESYHARVSAKAGREEKSFISENFSSANWLVKSLQQRSNTILKVAAEIVRQQDGFFRGGVGHLRPLILRDVAGAVEMHESTVSRVTANKYIATPRGTFELKYFFTTALSAVSGGESHSAEAVRHRIRALVVAENPEDVLSDDAIVALLRREGVDIARRTVAKYRDALRIPSSVQRKREKSTVGLAPLDRVG